MNVCVCGVGLKGETFIRGIFDSGASISKVISYNQEADQSRGFELIARLCTERRIPLVETSKPRLTDFEGMNIIFMVGWQFMLPFMDSRIVAFHDSLLPKYRGFSPSVAALIAGEKYIGVTAFRPSDKVDAGKILGQSKFEVQRPARIAAILKQQASLMVTIAIDIISKIADNRLVETAQNESDATYSVWRDTDDYWIDWRWSASRIERHVYAVGYPYEGAKTMMGDHPVIVDDCRQVDDVNFFDRAVGKVWALADEGPTVICGFSLLQITAMRSAETGLPVQCKKLRTRFSSHPRADTIHRLDAEQEVR